MRTLVRLTDVTTTSVDVSLRIVTQRSCVTQFAIFLKKLKLVFQSIEWTSFVI